MSNSSAPFLVETLRQHPYFQAMNSGFVQRFADTASKRTFRAHTLLFLQGAPSAGLWVLGRGQVKVFRANSGGDEHVLQVIGPGGSFNDVSALDGGPNPASSAALSDGVAWVFSADHLRTTLYANVDFAVHVVAGLSNRVRTLVQQIENLSLCTVTARLARFLLQQTQDPALQGISRVTIAAHLSTTPETLSRSLRNLEQLGAIETNRTTVTIINAAHLRMIADLA